MAETRSGIDLTPNHRGKSVMREYLESDDDTLTFKWPNGENHYDFGLESQNLLKWEGKLSNKKDDDKAWVDQYRGGEGITFARPFAVKTLLRGNTKRRNVAMIQEVEISRGLYHPHITAFLGTYTERERLCLMIYPAGCGDLRDFMSDLSDAWKTNQGKQPGLLPEKDLAPSDGLMEHCTISPFRVPFVEKIQRMRLWFSCLAQAVKYLHQTDIRHKDIKPENIVIDTSGSVLLTDFGISRQFRPGTSHVTSDQWANTPEYASPEMMEGKSSARGDPSDIFSLGCVFIEMATVVLGKDLDAFRNHRATEVNKNVKTAFEATLPKIDTWIHILEAAHRPAYDPGILSAQIVGGHNSSISLDQRLVSTLPYIRQMLDVKPGRRPQASALWRQFGHLSAMKCVDCDEDLPSRWRPTEAQIEKTQGTTKRRSQLLNPENNPRDFNRPLGDVSENELDAFNPSPSPQQTFGRRDSDSSVPGLFLRRPTSPMKRNGSLDHGTVSTMSARPSSPLKNVLRPDSAPRMSPLSSPQTKKQKFPRQKLVTQPSRTSSSVFETRSPIPKPNDGPPLANQPLFPESTQRLPQKSGPAPDLESPSSLPQIQGTADAAFNPVTLPSRLATATQLTQPHPKHTELHDEMSSMPTNAPSINPRSSDVPPLQVSTVDNPASPVEHVKPQMNRKVIVYYEESRSLEIERLRPIQELSKDRLVRWESLPKRKKEFVIYDLNGSLIASVDLGTLGIVTTARRLLGHFPHICVVPSATSSQLRINQERRPSAR